MKTGLGAIPYCTFDQYNHYLSTCNEYEINLKLPDFEKLSLLALLNFFAVQPNVKGACENMRLTIEQHTQIERNCMDADQMMLLMTAVHLLVAIVALTTRG